MLAQGSVGFDAPLNVPSGEHTYRVEGTYNAVSLVTTFNLTNSSIGTGKYVLLKASAITNYVGMAVIPPTGKAVLAKGRETVNYNGIDYDCLVVTLVKA
jgi:hypothetical protein